MPKRYIYEEVKKYFKDNNCQLLSTEYIGIKNKLIYICTCGNEDKKSFDAFKRGQRCMGCKRNKLSEYKKLTYEYVDKYFEDHNCKLLSTEYIDAHTELNYICSCGNISKINFNNFQQGKRCRKCGGNEKLTYEYIKKYFEENNCILLSKKYINNKGKLDFICSCGNKSKISFRNFTLGQRCKKCAGVEPYTTETFKEKVYSLVKDEYLVLGNYINSKTKILIKHILCNHEYLVTPDNFINNVRRCPLCNESKGERKIRYYLENNNILHERQYMFDDCIRYESLPFDFAIFDNEEILKLLIEYDGEFHYRPMMGIEQFEYQQENDEIKNIYCKKNNIDLLRIPYWQFDNIETILENKLNN